MSKPDQYHIDRVFNMLRVQGAIKIILIEQGLSSEDVILLTTKIMRAVMDSNMIDDCYLESYRLIKEASGLIHREI